MNESNIKNTTGMILKIERYRVHDGNGIRTILFLKGCNLICPWCCNPESQHINTEVAIHKKICKDCGTCINVCLSQALSMSEEGKGIIIDRERCVQCGTCIQNCPNNAIEIYGEKITVDQVMESLKKDMVFYFRSQGGITISGGEPTMQADFVQEILHECKKEYYHTAIETCGLASWKNLWKCCEQSDDILFDVKTLVSHQFTKLVHSKINLKQSSLEIVKSNIIELRRRDKNVIFRCVVVPGFNDSIDHINLVMNFALETGVRQIDILPFHQYGKHKYSSLGRDYIYKDECGLKDEDIEPYIKQIEANGLLCTIGG
jgi:pyruvate formate lyase activating enzyme